MTAVSGDTDLVTVRTEGPVRVVTINRHHARNAVDNATARALVAAFEDLERDDTAAVAVITGADGAFCAGGDLKEVAAPGARVVTVPETDEEEATSVDTVGGGLVVVAVSPDDALGLVAAASTRLLTVTWSG